MARPCVQRRCLPPDRPAFAEAISKTFIGGEIDALDDAGFGTLTITKSITIDGGGHLAGVLASGTNEIVNQPVNVP